MGPPTISADQLGRMPCSVLKVLQLQWGRRRSRRINEYGHSGNRGPFIASMGPPTISADQLRHRNRIRCTWLRFNGAADDLGGSTEYPRQCVFIGTTLQWGRRRSRRINGPFCFVFADIDRASMGPPTISADQRLVHRTIPCGPRASMGPPTISADQLHRLRRKLHMGRGFNGAADDLGGSTYGRQSWNYTRRRLQWGRRRSRRINIDTELWMMHLLSASMGPPTISADQRHPPGARSWRGFPG